MKQLVTTAIILSRIDYGEADRIITLLTPDFGKLTLLAKGVRRVKSKMAGGIELFSVSQISFIKGRSDMGTLVSTRLAKHYGNIVNDLDRTMLGYDLIKLLNKITEDEVEPEYFELLNSAFEALDDSFIPIPLIKFWFSAQILRQTGHTPNLQTDTAGTKLNADSIYNFDFDRMSFAASPNGGFGAGHIKFLRLSFDGHSAKVLTQVQGADKLVQEVAPLVNTMLQTHLRV